MAQEPISDCAAYRVENRTYVKRVYGITRDLHLYFGLFISPFVLVFAITVPFLVHAWIPGALKQPDVRTATNLPIPANLDSLKGREQVDALRGVLDRIEVSGEVSYIRRLAEGHRLVIPVNVPGRETVVDLDLATRSAVITERGNSIGSALVYLHKMPGPHNASIRVNAFYMRIWSWLADATVYLVLFLSISGIYLWTVLQAERRVGLALLAAGAFSFFGLIYALSR